MEELQELRRYHDTRPEPGPDSVERARTRLTTHMRSGAARTRPAARMRSGMALPRRARPTWALSLAGAAVATLAGAALVTGLVVVPDDAPAPPRPSLAESRTARPSVTAPPALRPVAGPQDVAHNAAALAATAPGFPTDLTRWAYVKSVSVQTKVDGGERLRGRPKVTTTHEMWRRLDDERFATMEDGRLRTHEGSEFEVGYAYLLALPDDPDRLLAEVYETAGAELAGRRASMLAQARAIAERRGKSPEEAARIAEESVPEITAEQRDTWAFQQITSGMRDAVLPPRLRAAMYGALAKIPGVTYAATSSDLAKRKTITLYLVSGGYQRDEIFIDPETYAYLGWRSVVVKDHEDLEKGQIMGWDAVLETGIVDGPGRRP